VTCSKTAGVALLTTGQNGAVGDAKKAPKEGLGGVGRAGGSSTLEAQVRLRLAEDEALARALQEEEDVSTRRRTRGGRKT